MVLSSLTDKQLWRVYARAYERAMRAQPGRDWPTMYYYAEKWYRTLKAILVELVERGLTDKRVIPGR